MGTGKCYRIIYNNDGGEVDTPDGATAEGFLDARMKMLRDTQIDMISYCSHYSFGSCLHKSSVGTVPTPVKNRGREANAQTLIDSGRDCLQITVDWAHANGIDVAWSMRMNDCHDGKVAIAEMRSKFKTEHPEYLVGREEDASTPEKFVGNYRWWAGVNYAIPEVRQKALALLKEVCENYDVDGIELDWNRHNVYFPENRHGTAAKRKHIETMTGFMRSVRKMTDEVGAKRGRPITIIARVLDALEMDLHLGLDVKTWVEEKLLDILVPGDYWQFTDLTECVKLGHKHGILVNPCLSATRIHGRSIFSARPTEEDLLIWRGEAMNVWNTGADGIHTFNAWTFHVDLLGEERANKRAYVPLWKEIGNPETLGKLDKIYASTHANNNVDAWYGKGTSEKYRQFPTQLAAGQRANRSIRVYEDVSSADLKLRIRLSGVSQDRLPKLSFKFNGQVLESLEAVPVPESPRFPNEIWLETKTEAELIRNGQNDIEVTVGGSVGGGDEPMMLAGLQLHVRHSLA